MKNILVFASMISMITFAFGEGGATAYTSGNVVIFAQAYSSGNQVAFAQGQAYTSGNDVHFAQGQAYTSGNDVHFAQGQAYTTGDHVSFGQAQVHTKGSDIYFGQGKMSEGVVLEFIEENNTTDPQLNSSNIQSKGMALVQIKESTEIVWGIAYETVIVGQAVIVAQ